MITNPVIETLLQRRSIRKFKPDPIAEYVIATLETVAQHAASSEYLNDWSAIRITDESLRKRMAQIGNQHYIGEAPLLYVFILDEHRNAAIAAQGGVDVRSAEFTLNTSYRFSQAQNDAVLAMHAMETAANSLGLGCVYLGSLLNDPRAIIDALQLPEYTYPVLGLAIGKPDQAPTLKPRMARSMQFFENSYPADTDSILEPLPHFDAVVHQYYDLRHTERPVDAFSTQTTVKATDQSNLAKPVGPAAGGQGFTLDR
ncbi:nitroreductase family protein [Bifidobacterium sp.]|uniref:nitroreductase family protein n=1 Tax=Bifidobacterium sp. TaxID=41200 RepID=UPI0025BEF9BF|nr:nitroreductase family protein [Bifidobacterium sp.]MCH4210097.1 nitroreductase family protein [Bifidobacterium sp.]MCI1225553.1 nitroreductase family protein [Bifidobacterium sp.]